MAKQQELKRPRPVAVSVGFFILLAMVLFVFGIFWLKTISTKPAYTFKVAYETPDHLASGAMVYYRGVEVGNVEKVELSADRELTLVEIGIQDNALKLDTDVQVKIRLEGITGQRYVDIQPPEPDLRGGSYIVDGDLIAGVESMTWERIQKQLNEIVEKRTIEKTLESAHRAMVNLERASGSVNDFVVSTKPEVVSSARNIRVATERIASTTERLEPELSHALASVAEGADQFTEKTKNMDQTLASIDDAAKGVDEAMGTINEQLESTRVVEKVAETTDEIKTGVRFLNKSMGAAPDPAGQVKAEPNTVRTVGCTVGRINHMLKQRFLIFRLMFGKPGADYKCPIQQGAPDPQSTAENLD